MIEPAWAHTAGPFQAFQHRFAIRTTDTDLGPYLAELWAACRSDAQPESTYGLEVAQANGAAIYRLHADDAVVREFTNPSIALRDLVRRINADVIAAARDLVVVHAAGAVRDGKGVLFPAPMESGKTTLVSGLVRAGWKYLSDEAVGIDPQTLELQPYPKPLSVDPGSWEVLADLRPSLPNELTPYAADQWQIPPDTIWPEAVSGPVLPFAMIAPVYEAEGAARLQSFRQPQALMLLAESCFTLRDRAQESLQVLAALTRLASSHRLTVGDDLQEACNLVGQVLGDRAPI